MNWNLIRDKYPKKGRYVFFVGFVDITPQCWFCFYNADTECGHPPFDPVLWMYVPCFPVLTPPIKKEVTNE